MKTFAKILGCLLASSAALAASESIQVAKCTITAGKGIPADSIVISGILNSAENIAGATEVEVKIECDSMLSPLSVSFEVNEVTFKKDKFKSIVKDGPSIYTFTCDTKSDKFLFSAKNVDLTGLQCPFTLTITFNPVAAQAILDETIVNGAKPCPMVLLMGVWNNLDVSKFAYKPGKTISTSTLSAQGSFSIQGTFQPSAEPFRLMLGGQSFTIEGNGFVSNNGIYSCTNTPAQEGGLVSAKFDTNTGLFSIALKNVYIEYYGTVGFNLYLFGISLFTMETVDLGPKQTFSLNKPPVCLDTIGIVQGNNLNRLNGRFYYPSDAVCYTFRVASVPGKAGVKGTPGHYYWKHRYWETGGWWHMESYRVWDPGTPGIPAVPAKNRASITFSYPSQTGSVWIAIYQKTDLQYKIIKSMLFKPDKSTEFKFINKADVDYYVRVTPAISNLGSYSINVTALAVQ